MWQGDGAGTGRREARWCWIALIAAALAWNGCAAAAPAGAGAAVQLTDRGASSLLEASLEQTAQRTRRAFSDLGIRMKEVETRGNERTFKGVARDMDVTAVLDRAQNGVIRIEVTARRNAVTWDKEFAQRVLTRIVRRS
jgi:hypothetical protein